MAGTVAAVPGHSGVASFFLLRANGTILEPRWFRIVGRRDKSRRRDRNPGPRANSNSPRARNSDAGDNTIGGSSNRFPARQPAPPVPHKQDAASWQSPFSMHAAQGPRRPVGFGPDPARAPWLGKPRLIWEYACTGK